MGNVSAEELKEKFDKALECIYQINFFLNNYEREIKDLCKSNKTLEQDIQKFLLFYSKYEGLKRFSIPVIGKISSGKSTILNYILDLKETLQVESKTTTKFICIIRHNKLLKGKNPQLYTVEFNKRKESGNYYNFNKGDLIEGDIKQIIEKRNRDLNEKKIPATPENYFYLIENYIPFFEDDYEKYSNFFEFLDVPGLNEISDNLNSDNIYFEKVLPMIINNIKFSMFIFETKFYQTKNSISLYKKFIQILNSTNKDYFISGNILNESQENSIYILNKIDLCDKEGGVKKEEEDFKNTI